MEWLGLIVSLLLQFAFLGLIIWAIVHAVGRRREESGSVDQASAVRRLFVYGLMLTTLILTASGATLALQELIGPSGRDTDGDRSGLAFGLALVIVAGPAYGVLLRHARLRLGELASERHSLGWTAYLNLSLVVSLIVAIVATQQMFEGIVGVDEFEMTSVIPVIMWGAVWSMHWFWLKAAYGLPGDFHIAAGSMAGLVTLVIGVGGLAFVAGDEIYTRVVDRIPDGHFEPEIWRWVIPSIIGELVWSWHWLEHYLRAERTPLWHVYVVLIGSLGGLLAAVGAAATVGYWTLVWFLGDSIETLSSMHFEYVPTVAVAVLVVGAATWQYHRSVLQRRHEIERAEPLRAYDYLMAGAGLVAIIVSVTLALVALFEAITPDPVGTETQIANRLILAATLAVIGGPLWGVFWSRIRRQVDLDWAAELGSMVRRLYLIVLFGIGGIVVLISLISVLFVGLEDLLDGTFSGHTVRSIRVGLSLVLSVTGVAWYHLGVFRSDNEALAAVVPVEPATRPKHVVLITPRGTALAEQLAEATGAELETWYCAEETITPVIDLDELALQIEDSDAHDIVVVVGPVGPMLIPVET